MHVYVLNRFNHNEFLNFSFNEATSIDDKFIHYKYWLHKSKIHSFYEDMKLLAKFLDRDCSEIVYPLVSEYSVS